MMLVGYKVDLDCIDQYYVPTILMVSIRHEVQVSFSLCLFTYLSC
jgi:hypothetical protein